ncbi:hypothetical protein CASFOL_009354 [Castilleja foliolosa]|uniref:Retrotransposon gag domain-containing protein n=1 Tax=Castilleja foliolosa TaxID=1961234 RepID=A0ABD3E144_9LAMI
MSHNDNQSLDNSSSYDSLFIRFDEWQEQVVHHNRLIDGIALDLLLNNLNLNKEDPTPRARRSLNDDSKTSEQKTTENKDLTLRIAEILRKENHEFARTNQFMQTPNIEPKLNEKKYSIWARKVKITLGGRGRWHHITGVPEPPKINEPDYYIWEQNDLQVLSWINDSMESNLNGQFLEYPTALELWEGILETYRSGEDALQIYDLNIKANRLQQGEQSIEKYYQNCQSIWREIDRRDPNDMETPNDILKFNKRMQTFRLY